MLSTCVDHLKAQPSWILLLSSLGLLSLSKHTLSLLKWVFISLLRPPKNLKQSYGPWALITGSTDGIGKAFALQLAQTGLNLILVSRSPQKLKSVSTEIKTKYPNIEVKVVAVDFSVDAEAAERAVGAAVEGVEVGVLVNNVGVTYPAAMFFDEVEEEVWRRVVRVNLEGTTRVTRAVLPGIIERRRGAIVSIGSGAASVVPSHPLYAIYAATKAYVDQFSRCLNVEYKQFGIHVQCQVPLYVSTKMASQIALIEKSSLFIPSADNYARAAIRRIGYEARCTPYMMHSIQWFLASLLPDSVLDSWRLSIGIRRRGKLVT
ncbi:Very-long-chain 3-oxoacyl-CoA reductase-like protein [Actinidia chinensis var. chinensis]|uniref:Very-long-chain 3-oxoacyl-CoA reductase-like protein n=1 Tax=Actinidia chinensis var. chinensis TaxID=1590841 RepID=A0A2R6REE3_ACTCC|nr:Very-long-chain 3-oxoacyl-CoA reductase-like protein [Actinidia chinensis var. chinensis]